MCLQMRVSLFYLFIKVPTLRMPGLFFYLAFIARHTFSGVIGFSSTLTPTTSSTALPTADDDGVGIRVDVADDIDWVGHVRRAAGIFQVLPVPPR